MTTTQELEKPSTVEISVLPGEKILSELKNLPLSKLKLDSENVRFKHLQRKLSDNEIEKMIWEEDDTRSLYKEILASRGLSNKPVVDSNFVVKEGNRRLVCLRKLSEEAHAGALEGIRTDQFDVQQCLLLPKDTPAKAIAIYLAREHVSGKKEWAALNQAAYLTQLYEDYKLDYDDLKNYISMGKATVIRKVKAFKATSEYGQKYSKKDEQWIWKYSYFDEAYKKPTKDWMEEDGNIEKFMDWVFAKRLPTVFSVRDLPDIFQNPKAYELFEKSTPAVAHAKALDVLSRDDPSISSPVFRTIKDTLETLKNIPRSEFIATINDPARLKMLKELSETVDGIIKDSETLASKRNK